MRQGSASLARHRLSLFHGGNLRPVVRAIALAFLQYGATTQSRGVKSSVDDLGAGRGVVLSRAATTLRSIETQPSTGGFVSEMLAKFAHFMPFSHVSIYLCVCVLILDLYIASQPVAIELIKVSKVCSKVKHTHAHTHTHTHTHTG